MSASILPALGQQPLATSDPSTHDSLDATHRSSRGSTKKILKMYNASEGGMQLPPTLVLDDVDGKHSKALDLLGKIKIGRTTSSKTQHAPTNGFFDSKVLSRNHAELSYENGKILLRDVGSSNGTFVNGQRLSEENKPSEPIEVRAGDRIEFGVDILNETGTGVLYKKVTLVARIGGSDGVANENASYVSHRLPETATLTRFNASRTETQLAKANEAAAKELASLVAPLQAQLAKSKKESTELTQLRSELAAVQALANTMIAGNARESDDIRRKLDQLQQEATQQRANNSELQQLLNKANQEKAQLQQQLVLTQQQLAAPAAGGTAADAARLKVENEQLHNKINQLESKLKQLESQVGKQQNLAGGRTSSPRRQQQVRQAGRSWFSTLFLLLIVITLSAYVYLYHLGGLAVVDPLAKEATGYTVTQVVGTAAEQGRQAYASAHQAVNRLVKQYVRDEL
ncbi:hypothetical protein BCR44DRAFT_1509608 [Catenaria anguillulae PL171]|uniref:FHA domain-containing protein n=1 Tax=Catenaria anguillulae PL171 TaxID=765915 RepID=A0A1Y2I0G7_9FUNG|nr:hypothetical protein BCR44DRAFT_1509608 [Catenaria anguillulae PL171]